MIYPSADYVAELHDAAIYVCNARELCGDEAQALKDWQADVRQLTAAERAIVRAHVERIWSGYQRAAGVLHPISKAERARIARDLDSATPNP